MDLWWFSWKMALQLWLWHLRTQQYLARDSPPFVDYVIHRLQVYFLSFPSKLYSDLEQVSKIEFATKFGYPNAQYSVFRVRASGFLWEPSSSDSTRRRSLKLEELELDRIWDEGGQSAPSRHWASWHSATMPWTTHNLIDSVNSYSC